MVRQCVVETHLRCRRLESPPLNGSVRKGRFSAQRENASRRLVQGQLERQVCQDMQVSGHKLCRSVPWMVTLRWGLWMCV